MGYMCHATSHNVFRGGKGQSLKDNILVTGTEACISTSVFMPLKDLEALSWGSFMA